MKSVVKPKKRSEASRLGRDDWLDAAFNAVADGGFDAVRVLVIADTLGVTRGSFYWHFADHAALMTALLERWRQGEIEISRKLQANALPEPVADLEQLLEAALAHAGADMANIRFELAVRGLGRRDPAVATMLVELDRVRMELFAQKFERLTGNAKTAGALASLFYLAIVGGHQALSRPANPPQARAYIKGIISTYLIQQQVPGPG